MSYQVGVDLGTTYTAAAVFRDGAATIFTLGTRSAAIPSVVLLREDGTILTGDAAERRAMTEPERVVREFKRRVGDTTPIIVGGAPYSPEALTARLLESVVTDVHTREGGPPSRIIVTHPANWGNYKRDLLQQAVRLAGLPPDDVGFLTEPEAAALSYAAQERIDPGDVVAVYDLGGGTFDAAVLRRTPDGFEVLGKPEGIERLGGIDFDAAVFAHITSGLGNALAELDHEDPAALAAVARLRQDCVEAKEALSSDTDASVPVLLPNLQTEVRITRQEFESLIRPSLLDSLEAMKRAVRSASLELSDVTRVLLVGGSSRIPLISLLVGSELGRPVAVDAHPKHAIAIGAAFAASGILDSSPDSPKPPVDVPARSGLDPNMTIVAPAHLYNPGTGSGTPLPVERPAASSPPKALPVERPGPSSPPKALPVERPGPAPGGGAPGSSRTPRPAPPDPPPVTPGRTSAQPAGATRFDRPPSSPPAPPPAQAQPGSTPPPAPGEHEPTTLYPGPGQIERTQVYPGGAPPAYGSGAFGGQSVQPGNLGQASAPPKKRSGLAWVLIALVVTALIVLGLLVAVALS